MRAALEMAYPSLRAECDALTAAPVAAEAVGADG